MVKPDIIAVFTYLQTISCDINHFRDSDDTLELLIKTRNETKRVYFSFSSPFTDIQTFRSLITCWNNREKITNLDIQFDSGKEKYIITVYIGNKQIFRIFELEKLSKIIMVLTQITTWMADDAKPVDFQLQYETWNGKCTPLLFSINEGSPSFFYRFPEGTRCIVD